jgi:hypothetical protein
VQYSSAAGGRFPAFGFEVGSCDDQVLTKLLSSPIRT